MATRMVTPRRARDQRWRPPCASRKLARAMSRPRTLAVIPTYDEAANVLPLSRAVLAQDAALEVLVVDDASPDGTGALVREASASEPRLHLLERPGKLGLGTAYLAGFRYGLEHGFDRIVTMDGDFSHDPSFLPALLAKAEQADLVVGSRYVPGGGIENWPLHRRGLSAFANAYTRLLLRLPVRDCTSGFRCYARPVIEAVRPFDIRSSGYAFLEEMLSRVHRAGFRIAEVPIVFRDRTEGRSKISRAEIYRAAWRVLRTALERKRS
jgi:glycosyltransferase involved in cell wall biosynthesis